MIGGDATSQEEEPARNMPEEVIHAGPRLRHRHGKCVQVRVSMLKGGRCARACLRACVGICGGKATVNVAATMWMKEQHDVSLSQQPHTPPPGPGAGLM